MHNETRSYFYVIPKNQGLHKSTAHIFSNNPKSTNHTSLTGTNHCYQFYLEDMSRNCKVKQIYYDMINFYF